MPTTTRHHWLTPGNDQQRSISNGAFANGSKNRLEWLPYWLPAALYKGVTRGRWPA
jgi:hypothetical protein